MRVGSTDNLNLPIAHTQTYTFHPSNSPFDTTSVLTTYSKVVATCPVTVVYDDKIPPINGFHTGHTTIIADPSCGQGDCISFQFLEGAHDPSGVCRIVYSDVCASV